MAETAYALPEIEETHRWPAQGTWTWEDYQRLPADGQRYEIIDGVLYVAPAPSYVHQFSAFRLARRLADFVDEHGLGEVLVAPFDVRLPGKADPVQPDVLFFRTGNEPRADARYFEGVPDLVVEVISPGSRRLDKTVKLEAYEQAGVPEYWLIDPERRSITVHGLDPAPGVYEEVGRYSGAGRVRSHTLAGFEAPVAAFFPRRG